MICEIVSGSNIIMQGHWSNSLGVDALKEPPYDVTSLFTSDHPTWQNISTVFKMLKMHRRLKIELELKKAGRPMPMIDFEGRGYR